MNDQLTSGLVFREVAAGHAEERGHGKRPGARACAAEIAEDVDTFERLLEHLGLKRSRVKPRLAIATRRPAARRA
jgi:hypothetical protein